MRIRIAIACVGLAAAVAATAAAVDRFRDYSIDRTPIAPLKLTQPPPRSGTPLGMFDRCIQERFRNVNDQGMARMPVIHRYVRQFSPETSEENEAVAWLREEGFTMGFFLGGRRLLVSGGMTEAEWNGFREREVRDRTMNGPIFITESLAPADFPRPWELSEFGRKALDPSAKANSFTGTLGRWSIAASPVRADRADCLSCHRTKQMPDASPVEKDEARLKVGDPLGVMIYVYARPQVKASGTGH
jgi:hypothetical protein